jgi:secreted PhoX family phosphatase
VDVVSESRTRKTRSAASAVEQRRTDASTLDELMDQRISRRAALRGLTAGIALGALGSVALPLGRQAGAAGGPSSLTFTELKRVYDESDHVATGYDKAVLIRWGDPVVKGAPSFAPAAQTAAAQAGQFGYNADFIAYLPLPRGSNTADHALLAVNHEYADPYIMFPGVTDETDGTALSKEQVDITLAAHGLSVIEVKKVDGKWQVVPDSPYGRRITMTTPFRLTGPAAGDKRLQTKEDPAGTTVLGTNSNCSGGTTPWGTVLSAEEGSGDYHGGDTKALPDAKALARYEYEGGDYYGWARFYDRFDLAKEPNEANRFGWVLEIDPHDPASQPVKRTALGRLDHEAAQTVLNKDGRVVVYLGDDAKFEYLYRFVSKGKVDLADPKANAGLLDEGVLSVARLDADGSLAWLPLVQGEGPLTAANGFATQADILIHTRLAADLLKPTPMDRPEDFEVDPLTGRVFAVLTKNSSRKPEQIDGPNPRAENKYGQILELTPAGEPGAFDHAADRFTWDLFIVAGDPGSPEVKARYHKDVSADGWIVNPDNITFDPQGRMWIATDGAVDFDRADGLYGVDTVGPGRALTRLIYLAPHGAEVTGPAFAADGESLFLSVQHPGEDSKSLEKPTTRWPDFDETVPPRPSVVVITRKGGGVIGV